MSFKLKNNSDKHVKVVLFGDSYEILAGEESSVLPERVAKAWPNIHNFLELVEQADEPKAEEVIPESVPEPVLEEPKEEVKESEPELFAAPKKKGKKKKVEN